MDLPASLNPVARRVATHLFSVRPEFQAGLDVLDGGHFEASIRAPDGSQAGALVVRTVDDGHIWVHFAPPRMWYSVPMNTRPTGQIIPWPSPGGASVVDA